MILCELEGAADQIALYPGDLIGRMALAALCLEDPRISEAHAMVSLREGALVLLALRGRFRVGGKVCAQVVLEPGLAVELAEGVVLRVLAVALPESVLAIEAPGLGRVRLPHTMTLHAGGPTPTVRAGHDARGDAVFWSMDAHHRVTLPDGQTRAIFEGDTLDVAGVPVRVVALPLAAASCARTRPPEAPRRFEVRAQTVRVVVEGAPPGLITGLPGKILAVVLRDGPVRSWEAVAARVWPDERMLETSLRRRFDNGLARLRVRLQQLGISAQLVRMTGAGDVQLTMLPGDTIAHIDEDAP